MFCKSCGKEIPDDVKFCPSCGADCTAEAQPQASARGVQCPRCHGTNIVYQREQSATIGAGTNKVVIQQAKQSKGCLYWCLIGWWWRPIRFICYGWFKDLLTKRKSRSGINVNASKTINHTIAVCQDCGNSWKVR